MRKFIITILASCLCLSSCEKYLDTIPTTSVIPDTYLQSNEEVRSMVMAIYNCFYDYRRLYPYITDIMTDNFYCSYPSLGVNEFATGTQNALSEHVLHKWSNDFLAIARANFLIKKLRGNEAIEEKVRTEAEAEARFLRGLFYLDLVTFYGRVPLINEDTPMEDMPREEISKVLDQCKADADFAAANLTNQTDPQKASVGAALMLRLRIAQYENDHAKVIEMAKAIKEMGYKLYRNYQNLFLEYGQDDPENKEIIFKINYEKDIRTNCVTSTFWGWRAFHVTLEMVDSYFTANGLPIKKIVASDGSVIPADPLYKPRAQSFFNRDPRFYMSILYPGQAFIFDARSTQSTWQPNGWKGYTSFLSRKHSNEHLMTEDNDPSDRIWFRYGEVLLDWAESENELNGPEGAYPLLDELRARVGMISVSESLPGLTQAGMRELIRNERRVELFAEGQRWFDIRRWGIAKDVMHDATGYDYTALRYVPAIEGTEQDWWKFKVYVVEKRSYNEKKDGLWPIPQVEMNANSCMAGDQNPGY